MVRLFINGVEQVFEDAPTVAGLLERVGTGAEGVAVEVNLRIIEKKDFENTRLKGGDRVEIIRFVGGGSRRT